MQMMPIKELKNGAKVSELCHATNQPVYITRNGYADMVIMNADAFENLERMARENETAAMIEEGISAIQRGDCSDAYEAIAAIRSQHGI